MLGEWIHRKFSLWADGEHATGAELCELAEQWRREHGNLLSGNIGIVPGSPLATISLLVAICDSGGNAILLADETTTRWEDFSLDTIVRPLSGERFRIENDYSVGRVPPIESFCCCVTVFSSGTTGVPRPRTWKWEELLDRVILSTEYVEGAWMSAYPLFTFAGIQALLYVCKYACTGVFISPSSSLADIPSEHRQIQFAMATPTFWRRYLYGTSPNIHRDFTFKSISTGGEIATQDVLDGLKKAFPEARVSHVYATSDFGSVMSVSDGKEGFPAVWLGRQLRSGMTLSIQGGELFIRLNSGSDPVPTGDAVRMEGERVIFAGRIIEWINVGGAKVMPAHVESVIRSLTIVMDTRVYGRRNAFTGQIVASDVVLSPRVNQTEALDQLHAHCRQHLAPHERPRFIKFLTAIPMTDAGKIRRIGVCNE